MLYNLFNNNLNLKVLFFNKILNDAPEPWQLGFQDSAAPGFTGIVELHNTLFFYIVIICISVFWVLGTIIYSHNNKSNPIAHKYLNHGRFVPFQKCFKSNNLMLNQNFICSYSTLSSNQTINSEPHPIKIYEDPFSIKQTIIKENKGKSGIYLWTNKLTNDLYVGQSKNLSKRFLKYFSFSYLKYRDTLIISRALIKYGYSNFYLTILEYCEIYELNQREQHYLDKLEPKYNLLNFAGCSLNHIQSEVNKAKISTDFKGVSLRDNSPFFGKDLSEKTKDLMNLKKGGVNNSFFGKIQSAKAKELRRQKALGIKHSAETFLQMSLAKGSSVNIYEKCDKEGFKLIGCFISIRKAANFLGVSTSTVTRYKNSGEIFKERYRFSSQ